MWFFIVWHASVQALQLWCKSRPNWPEDHLACQVEIEKDLWIASPQCTSSEPKWFSSKCAFEFKETFLETDQTLVVSSLELRNQSLDCARYHHQRLAQVCTLLYTLGIWNKKSGKLSRWDEWNGQVPVKQVHIIHIWNVRGSPLESLIRIFIRPGISL